MTLRDQIKADATRTFLITDDFAEEVIYYPRGGGARKIKAIVDRSPPSFYDSEGGVVAISFMIIVANNSVTGISAKELDTGGDRLALPRKEEGSEFNKRVIWSLTNQDFAMITLALK